MSETHTPGHLASYVYAVTRSLPPEAVAEARGVDDAEVHLVSEGGLAAVVSAVPRAEFDEEALKAKLEHLDWLEAVARAHHGVVDTVAARGVTLPLRLATVYNDDDRVAQVLREGYAQFTEALDRLDGRVELGVKVYVDPTEMAPAPAASEPASPDMSKAGSGRDYLKRRKEQRESRDTAWQQAAELGQRVDATLAELAVDVQHHRPQNPQLSGVRGENVLNAAYLVDTGHARTFAERARGLDGTVPGTRVELTGPWAPYSFALPDEAFADDTRGDA